MSRKSNRTFTAPEVSSVPNTTGGVTKVSRHPAFGQIRVTRPSGFTNLCGSEMTHQHYIALEINRAEIHRDTGYDSFYPRKSIIEVIMSESQWASVISSIGMGAGTPCTLRSVVGVVMAELPPPTPPSETFQEEMNRTLDALRKDLMLVAEALEGPLAKTKVAALQRQVQNCADRLESNATHVADLFVEHMEETTAKAKAEVDGYVNEMVKRKGLEALMGAPIKSPVLLQPHVDEEESK